jgi:CRP/FNR family cyclic AMP-dependent transcriptional regulator
VGVPQLAAVRRGSARLRSTGVDAGALLRQSELFGSFPASSLSALVAGSKRVTCARNEDVFAEGDPAADLYVVESGRVSISNRALDGRESMMALMESGDLFGDMGLFDGLGRSARARSLEQSKLLRVPYPVVRACFDAQPELLWAVVAFLSRRLRVTDMALADAMFLDVPARTAKRFLDLAGEEDEFHLPLTQEELASLVGASRERVNKAIASFVRLGWITQSGRHYTIVDRAGLENRAR